MRGHKAAVEIICRITRPAISGARPACIEDVVRTTMHGMFECHMGRDVVDGGHRRRKPVEPLQEFRHKCALLLDPGSVGFGGRDIGNTFDSPDASWNVGKSEINSPRPQRLQMPHSQSAKSPQLVFFNCERYRTVAEKAYRKGPVDARDTENRSIFHSSVSRGRPSADRCSGIILDCGQKGCSMLGIKPTP